MSETTAGFIDAGFLKREGAKAIGQRALDVRVDASAVVKWFLSLGRTSYVQLVPSDPNETEAVQSYLHLRVPPFLRVYWYDGAYDVSHPKAANQRRFFNAIANTPGVQIRLGHIAERGPRFKSGIRGALKKTADGMGLDASELLYEFDKHWEFRPERKQKGVDTLIALDLVRLAGHGIIGTAILVAGDRDLAEAVRAAQNFGARVLVATPRRHSVAREVAQLADGIITFDHKLLSKILPPRRDRQT